MNHNADSDYATLVRHGGSSLSILKQNQNTAALHFIEGIEKIDGRNMTYLDDYRSRPKSTFDMHRTSGRSADTSMHISRKKPIQKFTEKASTFILNYDI